MSNPAPVPVRQQLIDLFNAQLANSGIDTEYTDEDLTFSDPVAYDPDTIDQSEPLAHNTRMMVSTGSGLTEVNYQLHFTRLDLGTLASMRSPAVQGTGAEVSTFDLLTVLSDHLQFELTEDDLEDLPLEGDSVVSVRLRAKETSLAVVGETTIIVTSIESGGGS